MTREENTGTTLQILAPYLPYGIQMQIEGGHTTLDGLMHADGGNSTLPDRFRTAMGYWMPVAKAKPILRPFSQLVEPLPDGSIPAVEVAKLIWSEESGETAWDTVKATFATKDVINVMEGDWTLLSIQSDFDIDVDGSAHNSQVAIVDYLRSKQFALLVNGRPLVEGVDFIAKSAASLQ